MSHLDITLLGSFRARVNGVDITETLRTRKERAILAYLAEESHYAHPREQVAEFFWPERPESYARMNLRQALLGIRRALGGEDGAGAALVVTEETIQLSPRQFDLDTRRFSDGLKRIKGHSHQSVVHCPSCIANLEEALESYRGGFLQDMMLGDVVEFQEWLVVHRERYFAQVLSAVQTMSEIYYQRADYQLAYHYAWRYLELAPLEESAHRLLMRLLVLSGRRNAALQQYEACRILVERELGVAPSHETRQLYEQIKNEQPISYPDTRPLFGEMTNTTFKSPPVEIQLYDPVTQIPTRPLFMDRLKHALVRMARDQQMAGVCVLSLAYPEDGELSSDQRRQVMQIAVRRGLGCMRQADTIALLNDLEFGLVIEKVSGQPGLQVVAEKIVHSLETPISLQGQQVQLRVVMGCSIYPTDGEEAELLLQLADAALRRARVQNLPYLFCFSSS
jgi:DNA-binding SARP family transcriptional activator